MIVKEILKKIVVKMGLLLIAIKKLKHVCVEYLVKLMMSVKKDIVACLV